jgi:hypothetical protein
MFCATAPAATGPTGAVDACDDADQVSGARVRVDTAATMRRLALAFTCSSERFVWCVVRVGRSTPRATCHRERPFNQEQFEEAQG